LSHLIEVFIYGIKTLFSLRNLFGPDSIDIREVLHHIFKENLLTYIDKKVEVMVHSFSPKLAKIININAAIVLWQIKHFMRVAKDKKYNKTHHKNGKWWAKTSTKRLHEHMPYLSISTINRAIEALEDMDVIISCKFNRYKGDQTTFYTIDYNIVKEIVDKETKLKFVKKEKLILSN